MLEGLCNQMTADDRRGIAFNSRGPNVNWVEFDETLETDEVDHEECNGREGHTLIWSRRDHGTTKTDVTRRPGTLVEFMCAQSCPRDVVWPRVLSCTSRYGGMAVHVCRLSVWEWPAGTRAYSG